MSHKPAKPLEWIGSSLKDMKSMPEDVRQAFGFALYLAQCGGKHSDAKPLKGIATPKDDIEKIKARLKMAEELHMSKKGYIP